MDAVRTSTPEDIKRVVGHLKKQIGTLQARVDVLQKSLTIINEYSEDTDDTRSVATPSGNQKSGLVLRTKRLVEHAASLPERIISNDQAAQILLASGLTTEKSKRFEAYRALKSSPLFHNLRRGVYQLVDSNSNGLQLTGD